MTSTAPSPGGPAARARGTGDEGTGLIALSAGVLVFLAFLLFAVQLLLNLFATTSVTSATYDGAQLVASTPVERGDPVATAVARQRGEERIRRLLGRVGQTASIDWSASTADTVTVRVVVDPPRVLLPGLSGAVGMDRIDRTVHVRVEQLR